MSLAALFTHPLPIGYGLQLWLVAPLCLSVALVYKAVRANDMRRFPLQVVLLVLYMLGGLAVLAAGLWAIGAYWP